MRLPGFWVATALLTVAGVTACGSDPGPGPQVAPVEPAPVSSAPVSS